MPNTREKLIELIGSVQYGNGSLIGNNFQKGFIEKIADHLIAHGVRLEEKQATSDETSKWITVKDGLPKLIPCGAGTAYSEAVNVLTSGRKVLTAIWDGFDWICDAEFWDAEDEEITHWTPVPLPLPEPPEGE